METQLHFKFSLHPGYTVKMLKNTTGTFVIGSGLN
jgi:hypothetical protein